MYAVPIASPSPSVGYSSPSIHVEKVARTPAVSDVVYKDCVDRLLHIKARQFAASGRVPCDSSQLVLFFRSKSGIAHSLDFPVNVLDDTPPALDVLIAACRPHQTSDLDTYGDPESLFFPPNLPLATSLEIANHPVLDAIRNSLFPNLPPGYHLSVLRDKLEVLVTGARMGRQPLSLRNDGRSATIVVTLPVRYRGGAVVVTEPSFGDSETFLGRGGKNGDLDWVAFLGDCDYEIDTVQSGCRVSVSYGIYIKGFCAPTNGPNLVGDEAFIVPSDAFFEALSSILNMSRGKKLGFFLNHSYNSDPSLTTAESLVPQLKGGDVLLYQAFKMYKLSPELQWAAGGYIWPPKTMIQFPTEDIAARHPKSLLTTPRTPGFHGYGVPTREEPVRGAFGSSYYPTAGGHELVETKADILRIKVEEAGGIPLGDTDIQICSESEGSPKPTPMPYGMPKPTLPLAEVGTEHVYFVSAGELEKLVVNTLLVVYIP